MQNELEHSTCVLCGEIAITTAAHIPVCAEHFEAYAEEGRRYLPDHERVVYRALLIAWDKRRRGES